MPRRHSCLPSVKPAATPARSRDRASAPSAPEPPTSCASTASRYVVPGEFRAEAVVAAISAAGPVAGQRILVPRADIGREVITEQLRHAGAVVTDVVAYRTVLDDALREHDPDVYA